MPAQLGEVLTLDWAGPRDTAVSLNTTGFLPLPPSAAGGFCPAAALRGSGARASR